MRKTILSLLLLVSCIFAETTVHVSNFDFEQQFNGWQNRNDLASVDAAAARSGNFGLHVLNAEGKGGSSTYSGPFHVKPGVGYRLDFWSKRLPGGSDRTSVYVQVFNENGNMQPARETRGEIVLRMQDTFEWTLNSLYFIACKNAATAQLWIHSPGNAKVNDAFDDFTLYELTPDETKKIPYLSYSGFPAPAPIKVWQVYDWLPDKPQGVGYPVTRRDKWDHLPNPTDSDKIIERAATFMKSEPPELKDEDYMLFLEKGDRGTYEKPYHERTYRLFTFAVAEGIENKGRFLPALEREINAILHERSWVVPAHDSGLTNFNGTRLYSDLFASERASNLATVDWLFQDKLKPETRALLKQEVFRRSINPFVAMLHTGDTYGHGWMYGTNNWTAVCPGNMVNCILTLADDKLIRAEAIVASEFAQANFLSGFTDDGYCSEGLGYWGYGFGHFLAMGEHILQNTGGKVNIFANPKVGRIAAFAKNIQIEDGIAPAFADCNINIQPSIEHLVLIQRHWPQALRKRLKPRQVLDVSFPFMPLIAFDDETQYSRALPEDAPYPIRSEFPQAGIYVFRDTDEKGRVFGAAIKGGHNAEHHNHNDVGSFVVSWNSCRFVIDPGGEAYTRDVFSDKRYTFNKLNSFGHPVPVVAGKLQSPGPQAQGKIIKTELTDEQDTLVIDFTSAYDVPELKSLIRTFVFNRPNKTITLTDAVEFTEPKDFSTALISNEHVFILSSEKCTIYNREDRCLNVQITADAPFTTKSERIVCQFEALGPNRIGVFMDKPVRKGAITMTLSAGNAPPELAKYFYQAPDVSAYKPQLDKAIVIQAEDFTKETLVNKDANKVAAVTKVGSDGLALMYWDSDGHSLAWNVTVPQDGAYLLQLKACCDIFEGVRRIVKVDGKDHGSFQFPRTGGWSGMTNDFKEIYPVIGDKPVLLMLTSGEHTLELVNDKGGGLNLDRFKLVPATKP